MSTSDKTAPARPIFAQLWLDDKILSLPEGASITKVWGTVAAPGITEAQVDASGEPKNPLLDYARAVCDGEINLQQAVQDTFPHSNAIIYDHVLDISNPHAPNAHPNLQAVANNSRMVMVKGIAITVTGPGFNTEG